MSHPSELSRTYRRHFDELDFTRRMHAVSLSRAMLLVVTGMIFGAVVGSDELRTWSFNLPLWMGPARDVAFIAADGWHQAMTAVGATEFFAAIRDWFRSFQVI